MIYKDNNSIKQEIKKLLIDEGKTQMELAEDMNISRQQLNNTFNKTNFSFNDLQKNMRHNGI